MSSSKENKYTEAVELYASTQMSIKQICEMTHVSFKAFCSYLSRCHRDLILKRHKLQGLKNVKLRGSKGQTTAAHLKYHDAIAAANSMDYIEFNISQIARIFGLGGTLQANQLRRHYPEVMRELGYNEYFRMYVKAHHPEVLEERRRKGNKSYSNHGKE